MKLPPKYRVYLSLIGGFSLFLLSSEIFDRYSQLMGQYREYTAAAGSLNEIQNFETEKFDLLQKKKFYTAEFSSSKSGMSGSSNDIFGYVTQTAKRNGVVVASVQPLPAKKEGYFIESSFTLALRGRYVNMGKFFAALESGLVPITLSKIELKKGETKTSELAGVVELKAYFYDAKEPL